MRRAICFLTVHANPTTFRFAESFKQRHPRYDVFLCIDKPPFPMIPYNSEWVTIIQYNHQECESRGYMGTVVYCLDRACSRDKALYHFCCDMQTVYDHVWFLEEDVFVPTIDTLTLLDGQYPSDDLLSAFNETKLSDFDHRDYWQHWSRLTGRIDYPWAHSMISAVRVSNQLLGCIKQFANNKKHLLFDECLFNTLALQNNLIITCPPEMINIVFSFHDEIPKKVEPTHLYHPIKDLAIHEMLRKKLSSGII